MNIAKLLSTVIDCVKKHLDGNSHNCSIDRARLWLILGHLNSANKILNGDN